MTTVNQHIRAGGTRVDDGMAMPLFDRVGSVRGVEIASRPEGIDGQQSRLPRQVTHRGFTRYPGMRRSDRTVNGISAKEDK